MSSIYVTEPPPSGKVMLETNRGDIEVELFADQCPLACKNFIALALEGYYDNMVWHRYVPDFVLQTGDPSGTGVGGESFYGHDFADEPHQRLRFTKRGMLAMANGSDRNSNGSQFFLTLAPTPELQGKHTLFGRISNKTIYNLIALADSVGECDGDRPLHPPKLKTIRVLENPFEGQLQLRITREERETNRRNRRQAEERKKERGPSGVKNKVLLSFGEEEGGDEEEVSLRKAGMSIHDTLAAMSKVKRRSEEKKPVEAEKEAIETPIEKPAAETDDVTATSSVQTRPSRGLEMLQAYRTKYKAEKAPSKKDEETARMLDSFRSRLKAPNKGNARTTAQEIPEDSREYGGDGDEEADWRNHAFSSGKTMLQDQHREDEYVVMDPRSDRPDKGRRGRDWVDSRDQPPSSSKRRR